MKYGLSDKNKKSLMKKFQISIWTNYLIGISVFSYVLFINWNDLTVRLVLILCLLMFPVACWLFDKNIKNKLSTEYEIQENYLIIFKNNQAQAQIPIDSMRKLTKIRGAHKVEFKNKTIYILDSLENKEHLLKELNRKTSR